MANKVLLIDDYLDFTEILADTIRDIYKVEVHTSTDGIDGVRKATELMPDLIFLDLALHDMTGFDIIKLLDGVRSNCKVIALTGFAGDGIVDKIMAAGFDDYLVKPIEIEQFSRFFNKSPK